MVGWRTNMTRKETTRSPPPGPASTLDEPGAWRLDDVEQV
jgi:hypothetical protein